MGGFLQYRKAEGACSSFDGVRRPKDGVHLFGVGIGRNQIQQVLLHIGQQFVGFIKESLIKIADIHAHAITSDRVVAVLGFVSPVATVMHLSVHSGFARSREESPAQPGC